MVAKKCGGGSFKGVACIQFSHAYNDIISLENLLLAWEEFRKGKRKKRDVQEFEINLTYNIFLLHRQLLEKTYTHGGYHAFNISDPKPRNIHKALVRDRVVHHAIYRKLYPFFDRTFIADSFSCRKYKGTHRALERFKSFGYKVSKNNTCTAYVLKCDIRKFFATIDQVVLFPVLSKYISDSGVLELLKIIVSSFNSGKIWVGLPLGNLTSQLLVNIYMNEFDQFVKHWLGVKYYIRYADDFVIMSNDKEYLQKLIPHLQRFLIERLKVSLHPHKLFIKTYASGADFLGWVHFPHHRVLRTVTKKRMLRNLGDDLKEGSRTSYLGLLKHGNTHKLQNQID